MKISKNALTWVAFFSVGMIAAGWVVYHDFTARNEILSQGKIVTQFWLPENSQIHVNEENPFVRSSLEDKAEREDYFIIADFNEYKKFFDDEPHDVWLHAGWVEYTNKQGKCLVFATTTLSTEPFITYDNPTYLGGGKIQFNVYATRGDTMVIFVRAVLFALVATFFEMVIIILGIILWWMLHDFVRGCLRDKWFKTHFGN